MALVSALTVLGFLLILTHKTLFLTLLGMALWGAALYLVLRLFPQVPGAPIFSSTSFLQAKGGVSWTWWAFLSLGLALLGTLRVSDLSLQNGSWLLAAGSLLLLGGLLALLDKKSPACWTSDESPGEKNREWPWREIFILLVGSFFLFYRLDQWPNRAGGESLNTLMGGRDMLQGLVTTPYIDVWEGNPYLPCLVLAFVVKLFGVSLLAASVSFAFLNLVGLLFFFGFLRFYLPKDAAFVTTLLFASSHWNLFMARQTFEGASLIVPFTAAALFFFARAVEKGKPVDFALFGLLLAGILNTYMSSRYVLVFFLLSTLLLWCLRARALARQWKLWVLAWCVFLLWYSPMIVYYFQTSGRYAFFGFSQRMAEINIMSLCLRDGNWGRLWDNFQQGFQMFTVRTTDTWTSWFPFLSPWESLGFLAGFAWCLWRFYQPAILLAILGFFGGMSSSVLSNIPTHANRALAGSLFVYLLVGIGLNLLGRVVIAPLGKANRILPWTLAAGILALSMGWQYDIYFHQLPKSWIAWVQGGGLNFLAGKTLASYPGDWDLYVTTSMEFNFEVFSPSKKSLTDWNVFYPGMDFPFQKVPEKGLALLVPWEVGESLENWMHYYYPDSQPRPIQNPFGSMQFLAWDLTPDQVRKALSIKVPPPGGLTMSWYDSKDRRLGQWRIPTLGPGIQVWLDHPPGSGVFFPDPTAYFTVQGLVQALPGQPFRLETTGNTAWTLGSQAVRMTGPLESKRRILKAGSKGWVPLRIRYQWLSQDYTLNLERMGKEGWTSIPSEDLRP